jgi:hypothetical protein
MRRTARVAEVCAGRVDVRVHVHVDVRIEVQVGQRRVDDARQRRAEQGRDELERSERQGHQHGHGERQILRRGQMLEHAPLGQQRTA